MEAEDENKAEQTELKSPAEQEMEAEDESEAEQTELEPSAEPEMEAEDESKAEQARFEAEVKHVIAQARNITERKECTQVGEGSQGGGQGRERKGAN